MLKRREAELVCWHGMVFQNCSICCPQDAHKISACAVGETIVAARPRLLRLAQLNGIGPDEVEDVVQETWLEAWRSLEKLREPERLVSWLDGICRNICKRHLHAKSAELHVSGLPEDADEEGFDLSDSLAVDPLEELEHQDMQVLLDRALTHLSESARELVELCYLAELPRHELARRLNMSLAALELKLHRARQKLHQVLHRELREDAQSFGLLLTAGPSSRVPGNPRRSFSRNNACSARTHAALHCGKLCQPGLPAYEKSMLAKNTGRPFPESMTTGL